MKHKKLIVIAIWLILIAIGLLNTLYNNAEKNGTLGKIEPPDKGMLFAVALVSTIMLIGTYGMIQLNKTNEPNDGLAPFMVFAVFGWIAIGVYVLIHGLDWISVRISALLQL